MTDPNVTVLNITRAPENSSLTTNWLLYVIPSIAFVLGVFLFSLVFRTQRHKEKAFRRVAALKAVMNTTSAAHTYTSSRTQAALNKDTSKLPNSSETEGNLIKQEAQSYENVTTIIYSNEDKHNYRIIQDEDYITPDTGTDERTNTDNKIYLQPTHHPTDNDGESYENMESCVYAHPRQPTLKTEDDDYINPDKEQKHNLLQTDTASYENMADCVCPDIKPHTYTHSDEGWYECMDRRQAGEKPT